MVERREWAEPVALLLAGAGRAREESAAEVAAPAAPARPVPAHTDASLDAFDARVEAVLMTASEPLPLARIGAALDRPLTVVRQALERIRADYDGEATGRRRGFELREVATGWRLYVRPEHDVLVREMQDAETTSKLSQAALETLAVVAYKQPISRGRVAAIRAVSVDSVMRTLLHRGLIEETGTQPETGAMLYGTTPALLVALGIRSIDELPPIGPLLAGAEEVAEGVL